ncbi:hypothetical protein ACFYRD_27390 [Streptomyces hirsutus]|uniref:hypothetical protein n=1 Tax=Streptomyces hirsutus TaxID=35620 RepID=UPI00362BF490
MGVRGDPARTGPTWASGRSLHGPGILHTVGTDPAPRPTGPTWREFLAGRAEGVTVVGFFHLDTALGRRLLRTRVLGGVINEYRYTA